MPSLRPRRLSAEASPSTIPESTFPLAFTGVHASNDLLAAAVLVRFWRWRRGLLEPVPDRAFFDETFDGFGTDALPRLLLHRLDDLLDVFGGVVEILIHCLLLFSSAERRTSATRTILETDEPPGLPAIHPGRHAPWVDLRDAGNRRDGVALVAQQEAMGAHPGASRGMMGMHLLQGLDGGVAQGGDLLHRVCSRSIGWTKAHWEYLKRQYSKSRSDPIKISLDFIPKLMSWYLVVTQGKIAEIHDMLLSEPLLRMEE